MIHYIAISAEIALFQNERILNKDWSKKFPGAFWISLLAEKLISRDYQVTTADVAFSHVKQGFWKANEIAVIQHLDDYFTESLIKLGADSWVIFSGESPLYTPKFYLNIKNIGPKFKKRILFSGLFEKFNAISGENHVMRFPSYSENDRIDPQEWDARDFLTIVVGNKYVINNSKKYLKHPIDILRWIKRSFYIKNNFNAEIEDRNKLQLQDKRLAALIFFGGKKSLKLYGKGWDNLKNLPKYYQNKLSKILNELEPKAIEDKIKEISSYKFVLCFENFSYPGYVTEKIIDCFVAGSIPVYLGAPNIKELIPYDSFINVNDYVSWEELLIKLESIEEKEGKEIINNGKKFLDSKEGYLHSYEGFASLIDGFTSELSSN